MNQLGIVSNHDQELILKQAVTYVQEREDSKEYMECCLAGCIEGCIEGIIEGLIDN